MSRDISCASRASYFIAARRQAAEAAEAITSAATAIAFSQLTPLITSRALLLSVDIFD